MTEKTALWDRLGKTDPSHTKPFTRAGGFKGTAIKPMWSYRRMTEEFGPCGVGWGINEPSFQVVPAGEEVLVYCTVSIWFSGSLTGVASEMQSVFGVGGDKVLSKTSSGARSDDEAFKKAYTDAVTNALKMIGVGADVHMGMFDDNKYVNTVSKEYEEVKSSAALKRDGAWEKVVSKLAEDMLDVNTFGQFEMLKADYRELATQQKWNRTFMEQLKDVFEGYADDLQKKIAAENDTVVDIQEEFAGSRVVNETLRNHPLNAG